MIGSTEVNEWQPTNREAALICQLKKAVFLRNDDIGILKEIGFEIEETDGEHNVHAKPRLA
jgi:hypothetical protein